LGIVHPDKPGDYLVGVECDGATYHSAATARDRDKVRSAILQGLGWKLLRLWSTEWWIDKEGALDRLDTAINRLLEESRAAEAALIAEAEKQKQITPVIGHVTNDASEDILVSEITPVANDEEISTSVNPIITPPAEVSEDDGGTELKYASTASQNNNKPAHAGKYVVNDLQEWHDRTDAEQFYIAEYDETLKTLIEAVVTSESPVLDTTLVQRIARIHGFTRAGRLIRERVMEIVDQHYHLAADHSGENFVWLSAEQRADWNAFRLPATDNDIRQVDAIPSEELRALALSIKGDNKIQEMTRSLGIKRLTSQAKKRIESILNVV
ncbi:hypothetical protein AI2943V1_5425, partial (plasmid) [Klebsiella oxytoca]